MTSILCPNCYIGRGSPLFIPQIGVILLPFFALTMWGLSTSLSIWSSKSDPHHHGCPSYTPRAKDNSSPWWHLVSLMYVWLFWDLDDQMMRLLHVTCPFDPDYCCHYCIFPTRYLLYPPLPLALTFEVCLACRVNANSSCPCRSRIRVNANRSYPSSIGLPLAD